VVFLLIQSTQGNLLEADVEALVNTVNMVGMELLATTDWLIAKEHCETQIESLMKEQLNAISPSMVIN